MTMRLYYAPQSSAALRALLLVRIKNLESTSSIKLIKVGNARNKKEFETSLDIGNKDILKAKKT